MGPHGYARAIRTEPSPDFLVKVHRLVGPQPLRLSTQATRNQRLRATSRIADLQVVRVLVALSHYFVKEPDLIRGVLIGPGKHDQTVTME